jgi:hypothetical protein
MKINWLVKTQNDSKHNSAAVSKEMDIKVLQNVYRNTIKVFIIVK